MYLNRQWMHLVHHKGVPWLAAWSSRAIQTIKKLSPGDMPKTDGSKAFRPKPWRRRPPPISSHIPNPILEISKMESPPPEGSPAIEGLPSRHDLTICPLDKSDVASQRIDQVCNKYSLKRPVKTVQKRGRRRGGVFSEFYTSMSMTIPDELLKPAYRGTNTITGVGFGNKQKVSERFARINLIERLDRMAEFPVQVKGKTSALKDSALELDDYFVNVNFSPSLRDRLKAIFAKINSSDMFSVADISPAMVGGRSVDQFVARRRSLAPLTMLTPDVIRSLPGPPPRPAAKLPIWALYHQIISTIEANSVTVLSAATGSGKTTQLPQFILDHYANARQYYGRPPSVVVTQPRRIAAKSVSVRVSSEREAMARGGGHAVGYSVRFDSRPPMDTRDGGILFCTSGILLRRLQNEPFLDGVTHLILDEVHERDVFTDILLLAVRNILKHRPDLKVVLMSATMETNKIARYFKTSGFSVGSVLDVEGTNYPVSEYFLEDVVARLKEESKYPVVMDRTSEAYLSRQLQQPPTEPLDSIIIKEPANQEIPYEVIAALIKSIAETGTPGAILVFLPGWEEINTMNDMLNMVGGPHQLQASGNSTEFKFYLLHSTAPASDADDVFITPAPHVRKIILATNIAESSVTIPDVVHVVDSGKQKVMHYDQRHRMNILEPCWISKANRRQRLGRAGRCRPGNYFAIYSQATAQMLPDQTQPELLRLNLDDICLNLKAMGMTRPSQKVLAEAIDPPDTGAVRLAIERLKSIGAIEDDEALTPLGRLLANLPVTPVLGKMLITSILVKCLDPVLTMISFVGSRIFKPARLPYEKQALQSFLTSVNAALGLHSDHMVAKSLLSEWIMDRQYFNRQHPGINSLISYLNLRRVEQGRIQLMRELKNSFKAAGEDHVNVHGENTMLSRLLMATGLYPDFAFMPHPRKRRFRLLAIKDAKMPVSSIFHTLGRSAHSGDDNQDGEMMPLIEIPPESTPRYFVYEELIDVGQKLLQKASAVDPLFFVLSAASVRFRPILNTSPNNNHSIDGDSGEQMEMIVDDWLVVRGQDGESGDLRLLGELRVHWNNFIQFAIARHLSSLTPSQPYSAEEQEVVNEFIQTLVAFAEEGNILRQPGYCDPEVEKQMKLLDARAGRSKGRRSSSGRRSSPFHALRAPLKKYHARP